MNRFNITRLLAIFVIVMPLMACETTGKDSDGDNGGAKLGTQLGTVLGALGGAILGSQIGTGNTRAAATAAGTVLGGYFGRRLGRMFDTRDRTLQERTAEKAMAEPVGKPVSWSNPDSGNSGKVTPLKEVTRPTDGATCREFEQTVTTKDDRTASETGTACRAADGTWKVSN
ncbi:MAG: surface antigen [Alphaproteobacteria bacterium]|jgi:surface antigen